MSDAIGFTGTSNNGTHRIETQTGYTLPLNLYGYQDCEYVLIAIDVATVVMETRYTCCLVLEKGENRTTNLDHTESGRVYTAYTDFTSSGTVTLEWGGNKPLHTKVIVIGF